MQETLSYIALSMGVAWASGINLYAAILVLGLLGVSDSMSLPETLQVLQNPLVIGAAGFMYCIEFFADKVPGVDSIWDTLHTFIRLPAGAVLAATVVGELDPAIIMSAALVGGGLTASTHMTKAGTRLFINTSPEPFSNVGVSLAEDSIVIGGLWLALNYPALFIVLLVIFIGLMVWLLPILWRGLKSFCASLRSRFDVSAAKRVPERDDS